MPTDKEVGVEVEAVGDAPKDDVGAAPCDEVVDLFPMCLVTLVEGAMIARGEVEEGEEERAPEAKDVESGRSALWSLMESGWCMSAVGGSSPLAISPFAFLVVWNVVEAEGSEFSVAPVSVAFCDVVRL